ncbi:protein PET100 homolog, mitochondrial [Leptopilina heterotoma]|uniref:protein PET100 homolog, mitochondrial n=1 Tax=Leptopilina heterotoma TaxID=63436 RepID=UPI001CAA13A5|nr:protein PET100 homolog, mitochondrial [Leptopilina heterotoma]XP_043479129.1 protein PET100 homolog, mitochondrial [Leptopilina heterotoma]
MGKWQLEVFKMSLYMAFPVGCFHYFNQPENFENMILTARREISSKETPEMKQQMRDFIDKVNEKRRLREVEVMEASDKKFQALKLQNS